MANVVMTTHWTGGDVYPFIRMGKILALRGHQVTIITHCAYEKKARDAGLNFTAIDTPGEWAEFLVDDARVGNPLNNLEGVIAFRAKYQCKQRFLAEYERVVANCAARDTVLFVRHLDSVAALLAAEKLGIPIIAAYMAPSFLTQLGADEELFGARLVAELNATRAALELPPARNWHAWWSAPKKVLGFWPSWFDTIGAESSTPIVPVGFALDEDEAKAVLPVEVQDFLANNPAPILISGGTGKQLKAGFYEICAQACQLLGRPALLVTQHADLVPTSLPDTIKWFSYLPFAKLMPLMGAIIHHGGINTCAQGLAAGIPQLVLGYYYDRPGNGYRLKQLGVADYLPPVQWKPDVIAQTLRHILTPPVHERCRVLAARVREDHFAENVVAVVEDVVGNERFLIDREGFLADEECGEKPATHSEAEAAAGKELPERMRGVSQDRRTLIAQLIRQRKGSAHDHHTS